MKIEFVISCDHGDCESNCDVMILLWLDNLGPHKLIFFILIFSNLIYFHGGSPQLWMWLNFKLHCLKAKSKAKGVFFERFQFWSINLSPFTLSIKHNLNKIKLSISIGMYFIVLSTKFANSKTNLIQMWNDRTLVISASRS